MRITIYKQYLIHGLRTEDKSNPKGLFLFTHSIHNINTMKNKDIKAATLLIPLTLGIFNKDTENISAIYAKAIDTVSERNSIHPKVTKANVINTETTVPNK